MITSQHRRPDRPRSERAIVALTYPVAVFVCVLATWTTASAATITTSFDAGYRDVVINGYGADGMGTFVLEDAGIEHRALCIEADVSHSDSLDAYAPVDATIDAPEFDALLWWLDRQPAVDDDTAIAAAALAWYYAGARRGGGLPVWADGGRGFAPISPTEPHHWGALPDLSFSHPVGLTSGGRHLDAAERRVSELHALASRLAPPWDLALDRAGRVEVHSAAGPVEGVDVTVTVERPDAPDLVADLRTDASGRAIVDLPEAPDGATIRAVVEAPGRHREWDGTDVQRMATATSETLVRTVALAPSPRHVEVHKHSTDTTIGVAGAVVELVDAAGATVERVTTSPAGVARFAPIDPQVHAPPWSVLEVVAPPGLVRDPVPIVLTDASVDPAGPTVVEVVNHPATVDIALHKRLSNPGAGPTDRSGFGFTFTRRADGQRRQALTDDDGRTAPVPLALGTYDVCEMVVPEWAQGLIDGGCVELVVDAATLASPAVEVDYLNVVPTPTIDTRVEDPADGDQTAPVGATTIVDRVRLDLLVPGTAYTVVGQIVPVEADATVDAAPPPPAAPTTAQETFVATGVSEHIDLWFDVADAPPGAYVIIEWLLIGDEVVARHHDLADRDQTFEVVPPPTTTSTTIAGTTLPPTTTPATTTPATIPPSTLPPTGPPEFLGRLLGWGDAGFVVGVALVAVGATRRRDANEAGR